MTLQRMTFFMYESYGLNIETKTEYARPRPRLNKVDATHSTSQPAV